MTDSLLLGLALAAVAAVGCTQAAPDDSSAPPATGTTEAQFTANNLLLQPQNYREWIYLSSGVGMNYQSTTEPADPPLDNVFVRPESYRSFLQTGTWPEKTLFVLEIRASSSQGVITKAGHFQTELIGLEAEIKDQARFPDGWAYFNFRLADGTWTPAAYPLPNDQCFACHAKNAAVEHSFVQFYPTLLTVAKSKGTLNSTYPH